MSTWRPLEWAVAAIVALAVAVTIADSTQADPSPTVAAAQSAEPELASI